MSQSSCVFFSQLGAALKKNALLKGREPVGTFMEIMLPVFFIIGLVGGWSAATIKEVPAKEYIGNENQEIRVRDELLTFVNSTFCTRSPSVLGNKLPPCPKNVIFLPWTAPNVTSSVLGTYSCFVRPGFDQICSGLNKTVVEGYFMGATQAADGTDQPFGISDLDVNLLLHELGSYLRRRTRGFQQNPSLGIMIPPVLMFAPNSAATQRLVATLNSSYDLFKYALYKITSTDDADTYARSIDGAYNVMAIVVVDDYDPSTATLKYKIRVNRTFSPTTEFTRQQFLTGLGDRPFRYYLMSGFMSIQESLHRALLKDMGLPQPAPMTTLPMPLEKYTTSEFLTLAGGLVPLGVVLAFMYPVSQLVKRLVEEKELRIREGTMIMGFGKTAFYSSWIITYFIMQFITAVFITLLLDYTILDKTNGGIIWVIFMLFGVSIIAFSILVSTFFSSARLAAMVSPVLFCIIAIPIFSLPTETPARSYYAISIFSPSAFALAVRTMCDYEKLRGLGVNDVTSPTDVINVGMNIFFLIFDIVWYFLLALYFDVVLPSQWGTRLHPCFCFLPSYWCKKKPESNQSRRASAKDQGLVENVDPSIQPSIKIQKLRKVFHINDETRVAVDDLELNLYPDQVSVILGHNGAGKTTTINMITGMMDMTSGDCEVYGRTISSDMNAIRQDIGLCPQHNILWNNLTCREHLDFYATIKGMSGPSKEEAIIRFLNAVELGDKENTYAGNLSGGQKRKLSVAIAFIGQSRVVILDEPTAGMDVEARRSTWELIREMTPGRTIILTTHFMDEADILGHTVTIMSKGRLHCSGSPMFLKSRLGVGYTLTLSTPNGAREQPISELLKSVIPDIHHISSAPTTMSYRLPMRGLPQFPELFRALETHSNGLGVDNFGVTATTLEEIFIRIAMAEEDGASEHHEGENHPEIELMPENVEAGKIYSVWDNPEDLKQAQSQNFLRQFGSLLVKRFHISKRNRRAQCFQIVLPIVFVIFALLLGQLGPPPAPALVLAPTMYGTNVMLTSSNCPQQFLSKIDGKYEIQSASDVNGTYPSLDRFLLKTYNFHGDTDRMISFVCDEVNLKRNILFQNASGLHSLPEGMYTFMKSYTASATNIPVKISATVLPIDWSVQQSAQIKTIQAMITAIFVLIPFSFIPSVYTAWLVQERETKAKHLQLVSGLNVNAYWISNLLWDGIAYLVTMLIAMALFAIFDQQSLIGGNGASGATFLLFFLYGLSGIGMAYLVHFLFTNHSTAQNVVMISNFIAGFAFVLLVTILSFIESTKDAADALRYIFRFIPAYCLGEGLISLAIVPTQRDLGSSVTSLDWDVVGIPLVYMAVEFPCFFILTILFDNPFWLRSQQLMQYDTDQDGDHTDTSHEDVDVAKERKEVMEGRPEDLVTVKNLRKVFPTPAGPKVAVRYVTFGVKRAEIFGFLGTNGAGKTTTLSILSGEFPPSSGEGWIHGHNVVTHCADARRHLGYCPQFDALIDLLTPREHLNLYSALRGVPSHRVAESVENLIKAACLEMYADQPSQGLSGGNKRKLSLALALIGGPPVIFLDEPSAGMDPVARRSLWGTIRSLAKGRSVVLTTHHLEEVEALAQRVTIMDRGEMKCIGSLQHLKHKYGDGYELTAKVLAETDIDPLISFVTSHLSHASVEEIHGMRVTFMLPQQATVLSTVFEIIEGSKAALNVTDYSITQTSLEQVFMRIAQSGMDEEHQSTNVHRASRPVVPQAHVEAAPVF